MEVIEIVENYYELDSESKKAALKEIFPEKEEELFDALDIRIRAALRVMADADVKMKDVVSRHEERFLELLADEDAKIRALAAQILGNVGGYTKQLIDACRAEQTMFILPSFLLAIGRQKTESAKHYLENYTIRSDVDKHIYEEKTALAKALANFVNRNTAKLSIAEKDIIALECPNFNVTYKEARENGFSCKKSGGFVLVSGLKRFNEIYKLRTFMTAYLLLGKCEVEALPEKLASLKDAISARINVNNYRLEVEGVSHKERLDIIPKCVLALDGFVNAPSAYSFEIKLKIKEGSAIILLDPLGDKRFAYRKKAVSASIAPSVAASVCYAIKDYMGEESRVLDNFCGSGTMLMERSFYPYASLTGVDINQNAVNIAAENARALKKSVKLLHMDALKFTDKQYDEVICNMPFGLRVSTHSKNEKLYDAYVSILPRVVKPGGYAFLYTNEKYILEDVLRRKRIKPVEEIMFFAGGLYPSVYVLKF